MKPGFKSTLIKGLSIIKVNILAIIIVVLLECFSYFIFSFILSLLFKFFIHTSSSIGIVLLPIVNNLISILIGIFFFSLMTIIILTKESQQQVSYIKQIQYVLTRLIFMTLSLFLLFLIIFIGSILLIIPGIIFGIKFSQVLYFCLIDGENPINSLRMSAKVTKGKYLQLIGLNMVFISLTGILMLPLILLLFPIYSKFPSLIMQVLTSFSRKILVVFYYVIWKTLNSHNEENAI